MPLLVNFDHKDKKQFQAQNKVEKRSLRKWCASMHDPSIQCKSVRFTRCYLQTQTPYTSLDLQRPCLNILFILQTLCFTLDVHCQLELHGKEILHASLIQRSYHMKVKHISSSQCLSLIKTHDLPLGLTERSNHYKSCASSSFIAFFDLCYCYCFL